MNAKTKICRISKPCPEYRKKEKGQVKIIKPKPDCEHCIHDGYDKEGHRVCLILIEWKAAHNNNLEGFSFCGFYKDYCWNGSSEEKKCDVVDVKF